MGDDRILRSGAPVQRGPPTLLGPLDRGLYALSRSWRDQYRVRITRRRDGSFDGLGPAVRRQGEEPPMYREHHRAPHPAVDLESLFRTEVPIWPRLVILADLDHRQVERSESFSDRSK